MNIYPRAKYKKWCVSLLTMIMFFGGSQPCVAKVADVETNEEKAIKSAKKINATTIEVLYANGKKMLIDFYGENIFRLFQDNTGGAMRAPQAKPDAQILVDNPRKPLSKLDVDNGESLITITTANTVVSIDKQTQLFKALNKAKNTIAFEFANPILFETEKVSISLKESISE
ncbi:hypothetical protein [Pedobacter sp. SL55]|uniref:hypothetical protein n=1 Tax=Pedobacter sp. SL55 TaxID=2995161 RepID=UPI0022701B70|nr:hypothetical protein [Pedobacter sp. SL55]WAC41289.1 hypothetical protein OVA16_02655 [Pedobacter sp. SL55]